MKCKFIIEILLSAQLFEGPQFCCFNLIAVIIKFLVFSEAILGEKKRRETGWGQRGGEGSEAAPKERRGRARAPKVGRG